MNRQSWLGSVAVATMLLVVSSPAALKGGAIKSARSTGLRFEPNLGQTRAGVAFLARGTGYVVSLAPRDAVFRFSTAASVADPSPGSAGQTVREAPAVVSMKILGANPGVQLTGDEPLTGLSHYFLGSKPSAWVANVPSYGRVIGRDLYPGIDIVYYSRERQLEFDFVVHAGAHPESIDLEFDGGDLTIDADGSLFLSTAGRGLKIGRPGVFQDRDGSRVAVSAGYERQGANRVRFRLGSYDASTPLVIDPLISYSTFLGGTGNDYGRAIAVDASGAAYLTGSTESADFPSTVGPNPRAAAASDVFVTKLSPQGEIVYSTFLGGAGVDRGEGITVDAAGYVYITGATTSSDFPTRNAFQKTFGGDSDAFMAKLDPAGAVLVYSTYLGGSGFDAARGAAIDAFGNLITMGITLSSDFPLKNPRQPHPGGGNDAFVAKLDASGRGLVFSTYHGGSGNDLPFFSQGVSICGGPTDAPGWGVGVDALGFIYVAGTTESTDFPLANAIQSQHKGGLRDAFASKFSPDGTRLLYSTYIGGTGGDSARGLFVDPLGNAYLTGGTKSADFPITLFAANRTKSLDYDAFVLKLNPSGRILYSTFIGGTGGDGGNAIGVDRNGNAIFVGHTTSPDFPLVDNFGLSSPQSTNLFLAKVNAFGSKVLYSTYLGGNGEEIPCGLNMGLAVDSIGSAYIGAATASTDFPITAGAQQTTLAGGFDAFVTKVRTEPTILVEIRRQGDQNRLVVMLGNPALTSRKTELKLWLDSPALSPTPFSLVPSPLILSIPHMPATAIIDTPLPAEVNFPGTTIAGTVSDPDTGLVLDASSCSASPCN